MWMQLPYSVLRDWLAPSGALFPTIKCILYYIIILASLQNHFGVKSFECCTMCLMCHGSCRFWNLIEQSRSERSEICCNSNWRAAVHHETHKTSWCKAWLINERCNAARDYSHVFAALQLIHGKPYQEIQFRSTWSSANWVDNRWCSFCH